MNMERTYYLDGKEIGWIELIEKGKKVGMYTQDGSYCTSEAIKALEKIGHKVECKETLVD